MCTMVIPFSFFFTYLNPHPSIYVLILERGQAGVREQCELRGDFDVGALTMNGTQNLSEYRVTPQPLRQLAKGSF